MRIDYAPLILSPRDFFLHVVNFIRGFFAGNALQGENHCNSLLSGGPSIFVREILKKLAVSFAFGTLYEACGSLLSNPVNKGLRWQIGKFESSR